MSPSCRAIVLVVEDEPLIRLATLAMVADAGFEALPACNAGEALSILESRPDVRIVFTDINMPGPMDGLELAHAVHDRWPPIDLIVTSGRVAVADTHLPGRGQYLAKPYSMRQVTRALDAAMAAR